MIFFNFIIFEQFNYSLQEFRKSLIVEEVEMMDKMNFWRNGEVKKWGFINLLIVAAAVVVTYILSERNVKVALVTCIAGVVQIRLNIFYTKRT